MYCPHCGNEVTPGQAFCGKCGARQTPPPPQDPRYQNPPPPSGGFGPNGGNPESNAHLLRIFTAVCAAVYGLRTLGLVVSLFSVSLIRLRHGVFFHPSSLIFTMVDALSILLGIWMCLILLLIGFRRDPNHSDGLLVLLGAGGAGLAAVRLFRLLCAIVFFHPGTDLFTSFFAAGAGAVLSVAGVYLIQRYLLNESPLAGKDAGQLLAEGQFTLVSLGSILSGSEEEEDQPAPPRRPAPPPQSAPRPAAVQYGSVPPRLKTDRSLLKFILFNLITCGIYGWYFVYCLARDLNTACDGDGRDTPGLLPFLLLSFVTCGIYALFWYYSAGNRLAYNAPRYGISFQENGTTILLWFLLGSLLCGLGSWVAVYIIIKNTNLLCGAYNRYHNL